MNPIHPYDFVKQVVFKQEGVLVDFWPTDDKYKEVLQDANNVLQELQMMEDWRWLREEHTFGVVFPRRNRTERPRLPFDDNVYYKASTLYGDGLRLYRHYIPIEYIDAAKTKMDDCCYWNGDAFDIERAVRDYEDDDGNRPYEGFSLHAFIDYNDYIEVQYTSTGYKTHRRISSSNHEYASPPNWPERELTADIYPDFIQFNRSLMPFEVGRVAIADMQLRLQPFHICTLEDECTEIDYSDVSDDTRKWDKSITRHLAAQNAKTLSRIPDINYLITKTAAVHALKSPAAQAIQMSLADEAQKLLSSMRSVNSAATQPDYLDWDLPTFISVI